MTITASFVGNVGSDAEIRSASDSKVCNFSVAVRQGFGDNESTNWLRVDLWGKRGESLAPYITKGAKVYVTGELTVDEYQGKTQFRVRADRVDPFLGNKADRQNGGTPRPTEAQGTGGGYSTQRAGAFDRDLDDDVPFVTADPALECRVR